MDQSRLTPEFREFLNSLNANGVRYIVVGGFAVIAHGYVRSTKDLDLWLAVDPENARLVAGVIREFFGVGPEPEVFLEPKTVFRMGIEPNRIGLFTRILGVDFETCWGRRMNVEIDGSRCHCCHSPIFEPQR